MDVYDAPMLDYPADTDVHMHTNLPSPRHWPHADPSMEDDIEPLPTEAVHGIRYFAEDVEVDMEPAYLESTEYEMVEDDDGASYGALEVVDVDLADVPLEPPTQPHTPLPFPPTSLLSLPERQSEVLDSSQDDNTTPTHVENNHPADSAVSDLGESTGAAGPEAAVPSVVLQEHDREASTATHHNSDSHAELYDSLTDFESQPEPYDGLTETQPEPYDGPAGDVDAEAFEADSSTLHSHEHDPAEPVHDSPEPTEDAYNEFPHEIGAEELSGYNHGDPVPGEAHTGEPENNLDYYEGADPHEIMDGVYIEPPPAVLLDLPSAPDQPECCLFNFPTTSSRDSPVDSSTPSAASRFIVLLQHQPTLYYERLSEVFDALRQEEHMQHVPGLLDGEMVIDVYDLELEIFEDNVFAREVTLHDLNDLHDGSNLAGPLRLRLRSVAPRFIDRYRALREQIFNLSVADGGHDAPHAGESHDPPLPEEVQDGPQVEGGQDVAQGEEVPDIPEDEESHDDAEVEEGITRVHEVAPEDANAVITRELDAPEAVSEGRDAHHEEPVAGAGHQDGSEVVNEEEEQEATELVEEANSNYHEVLEGGRALETEGNDTYPDPTDPPEETRGVLDADAVHDNAADTDASTFLALGRNEYAELVEPREEDEQDGELFEHDTDTLDDSSFVDGVVEDDASAPSYGENSLGDAEAAVTALNDETGPPVISNKYESIDRDYTLKGPDAQGLQDDAKTPLRAASPSPRIISDDLNGHLERTDLPIASIESTLKAADDGDNWELEDQDDPEWDESLDEPTYDPVTDDLNIVANETAALKRRFDEVDNEPDTQVISTSEERPSSQNSKRSRID